VASKQRRLGQTALMIGISFNPIEHFTQRFKHCGLARCLSHLYGSTYNSSSMALILPYPDWCSMERKTVNEWHEVYRTALFEFDPDQLRVKLTATEAAICDRLQVLSLESNHEQKQERERIAIAIRGLRLLERLRLDYPPLPRETVEEHYF
jgi:hypothetical protein